MGCLYRKQPVFFKSLLASCALHLLVFSYVDIGGEAAHGGRAATLTIRFLRHVHQLDQQASVVTANHRGDWQMPAQAPITTSQTEPLPMQSETSQGEGDVSLPVYPLAALDNSAVVKQNLMLDPPDLSAFNQSGDIKVKLLVDESGSVASTEVLVSSLGNPLMEQQVLTYLQTLHLEPGRVLQKPARYFVIINLHYDALPAHGNASSDTSQTLKQVPLRQVP
ncbi:energy transducer TonB [Leeia oryzae]|uniref:energy transducer TonB n=1 Tax=Leeia oryzae TaxID=356662 RepID=UPI00035D8429|nr:hypothetical protein [Leeia oryzae]